MGFVTNKVRKALEENPNVRSVTSNNVSYTPEFIADALKRYKNGETATGIWISAGFDVSAFRKGYCSKTIARWLAKEKTQGTKSFKNETRGRKKGKKFSSLQEELEYLRAENEFLKELRALETQQRKK